MKKLVALGMALTMVMSILTGCGGSASSSAASSEAASSDAASGSSASSDFNVPAGAKVVKFGNAGAIGEPAPETCQYFCDLVNEKIGDRYYFEFYPAEQLGNETTMLENIQVGLQEGVMTSLDTLASYESDLNILSMAFAFDSYDSMIAYLKSDLGASIWESLDSQGMHVVNYEFKKNPRIFFAKFPITSPADMKGMKYRIPNLPILCDPSHMGGKRELIGPISQQALDMGFNGLIIESHCNPDCALSDAKQQVTPDSLNLIINTLVLRQTKQSTENLALLRQRIDECDNELLEVLSRRMAIAREIGQYKKEHNMQVVQAQRYSTMMSQRHNQAEELGMSGDFIETVMQAVHEESVRQQIRVINSNAL